MSRLPNQLQPIWPLVKRLHRLASFLLGVLSRGVAPLIGTRGLPHGAGLTSAETAAAEPAHVRLHPGGAGEQLRRASAVGTPARHWVFEAGREYDVPDRFVLEINDGIVVGDYGANLTPGGLLDYETSEYFGITDWREHPIFLRTRLPPVEHVDGTVVSLAVRGGASNYYHFLLDVLPRWGIYSETFPEQAPDAVYVPAGTERQRQMLDMAGLDKVRIIESLKHSAVRADRLMVPSMPNLGESAPPWTTRWLQERFPAQDVASRPRRLYITRGDRPNSRRLVNEAELWPLLERRGFVRVDPGTMSVQDQIDHFAAAEVIVAVHGAALTNLVFSRPGVRVLEMFTPTYVNRTFWAITDNIADSRYRYLIAEGQGPRAGGRMNRIQADVTIAPAAFDAALDDLLA